MYRLYLSIGMCVILALAGQAQEPPPLLARPHAHVEAADTLVKLPQDTAAPAKPAENDNAGQTGAPQIGKIISFRKIFWAVAFAIAGHFFIQVLSKLLAIWSERNSARRVRMKALLPVIKIFGWILIVYIIIWGIFQPPLQSMIALGASVGVAVGFASQDILKNIFGGLLILFDRPFKVGDKIEVGDIYGEVVSVSLCSTRILTADDSLITLPNSDLVNKSVSNSNAGEANAQVVAEIYLPLSVDTGQVRKIAMESAKVSQYIYLAKPIAVVFGQVLDQGRLYYKMRLKAYVMDIRYEFAFKSDMTEIVTRELIAAGWLAEGEQAKTN